MSDSNTLTVYAGWPAFGVADFSPACLKLKTYLRMAEIPYATRRGDPRHGPTKKIPFIVHGVQRIGDSGLIIEYLKREFGDPLDQHLSAEQQALGHLIRRTAEESLYFAVLYARWGDDNVAPRLAAEFAKILPPVIGPMIFKLMRKNTLRNAWGQGIARHTRENVIRYGSADLDAIANLLGNRPYLFGERPTSYDASVYGVLANVLAIPEDGPLAARLRSHPNLIAFVERVTAQYWATADTVA